MRTIAVDSPSPDQRTFAGLWSRVKEMANSTSERWITLGAIILSTLLSIGTIVLSQNSTNVKLEENSKFQKEQIDELKTSQQRQVEELRTEIRDSQKETERWKELVILLGGEVEGRSFKARVEKADGG